jgi:hypothetical protein
MLQWMVVTRELQGVKPANEIPSFTVWRFGRCRRCWCFTEAVSGDFINTWKAAVVFVTVARFLFPFSRIKFDLQIGILALWQLQVSYA